MKMAIIVLAYKDPGQIERFIKRMSHPSIDIYIHLDRKIDITPFRFLADFENVKFTEKRFDIIWASLSLVNAMLESAREILRSGRKYDFIGTSSAQDYPITSVESIVEYYSDRIGHTFFSLEPNDSPWWGHAITRVNKYHMTDFKFKGRYRLQYLINKILPKRKFPFFDQLYGGPRATFWTMSSECMRYVIDFLEKNPKLLRFAKYTWACDEFLLQTIVMNSHFKDSVINDNGRYIDWSQGGSNPKIFTEGDFDDIMSSGELFARKFDIRVDTKILDRIDEAVDRR